MLFGSAGSFFSQITPDSISAFFKGTGILGGIGLLLFLMIRHKVVRLVSVDRGSEWIRALWGVEQYHRFGKRRGRLVRLKAGRHLLIRGMYDGWEVCLREIPLIVVSMTQPFQGKMLQFDRLTISYRVIAPDTLRGDRLMLRSFLSVRNLDRDNQKSESLDDKVIAIALTALGKHLKVAERDSYGLPVISQDEWVKLAKRRLLKKYGVRLTEIDWSEPTWLTGQQQYDAGKLVANALTGGPSEQELPESDMNADVIAMQDHPHSAPA